MTFKSAYLKLTIFYVLIAMAVSIAFSIAIYNISSGEIENSLGRQNRVLRDIPITGGNIAQLPDFDQLRAQQLTESENNLKSNLFYFNLLILILSTGAGYFLARRTLQPIEEAMEAQNRFTADASHELRTPLTAMRTEIEVNLRDQNLNLSQAKVLLNSNLEEIGKLESLSNALLKLARFQKEGKDILKQVSLEEVVVEAYERVEALANKKSIEFDNDLKDLHVKGDDKSLVELFVILFDNAIKYSPEKSTISIKMQVRDDKAEVSVSDQGMGIKASDLPYIFNRFYRADTSRSKEKVEGYGLGLSIAKSILELNKGDISVSSHPGKGSKFTVKLPFLSENPIVD